MSNTSINGASKRGSGEIRVWINAERMRIKSALRDLIKGLPVQVTVVWTHTNAELEWGKPAPFARRLPVFERGGRIRYLKVEEIDWIEAERQYVRLHVGDKALLARGKSMTIKSLASQLDPVRFMRIHRSHIVNLERVEALRTDAQTKRYAVLAGGYDVPVSQARWEQLAAVLVGAG